MTVTIYHNPGCGTSRTVLARIQAAGITPRIIEYLKTPPSEVVIAALLAAMGMPARALLRAREPLHATLGLNQPHWTAAELIARMHADPILIQRPIVVTEKGTRLCRPPEQVDDILT